MIIPTLLHQPYSIHIAVTIIQHPERVRSHDNALPPVVLQSRPDMNPDSQIKRMNCSAFQPRQLLQPLIFLALVSALAFHAQASQEGDVARMDNGQNNDQDRNQAAAQPASIRGNITLLSDDGERVRDRRKMASAVAYFEPDDPPEFQPPAEPLKMTTRRREFIPPVLTVVTGTEVRFPNEDPILHNVFSTSSGNEFDLGVYGESPGKYHRFDTAGIVRVFCNVHSRMSAHIVVVNSPYFVTAETDGSFVLEDLPPGPGQLTVWHARAEPERTRIDLEPGGEHAHDTELALTVRQATPQRERFRRRGRY